MKFLLIILVFCMGSFAGWRDSTVANWNGWGDTSAIGGLLVDGTKEYSRIFKLTDGEDIRVLCKANDTVEAGFADDSIYFEWGYQSGVVCLNGSNAKDTCWDDHIVIDTMNVDSFGVSNNGVASAGGTLSRTWGGADTTYVTDYAVQSRWFVPEWDCLVRFWANSLGDPSKDEDSLDIEFEIKRKVYTPVRRK